MNTNRYYDENAQAFFDSTLKVDMQPLYYRFLPFMQEGGSILDAGCGSGRDAYFFKTKGYSVTAMDASKTLCDLASAHLNQDVHCVSFEDIEWQGEFNAVWACASLLHVPKAELPAVFLKLFQSLKPNGVLYCSFKYGSEERQQGGRTFTDLDEAELIQVLDQTCVQYSLETWITEDQRPDRSERWLNAIIKI